MPEQFTTYWPTYEGLRLLQADDSAELHSLEAMPRGTLDLRDLSRMSWLRRAIRERAEKLTAFEKLTRNILSGQPVGNGISDEPF